MEPVLFIKGRQVYTKNRANESDALFIFNFLAFVYNVYTKDNSNCFTNVKIKTTL